MTFARYDDEPFMVDACLTKWSMCSACFCSISMTTKTISTVRDHTLVELIIGINSRSRKFKEFYQIRVRNQKWF